MFLEKTIKIYLVRRTRKNLKKTKSKKKIQKKFFALKNVLKSSQPKKGQKKKFSSRIGLKFFAYHYQLVDRTVSRVAPVERKSIFAY